MQQLISLLQEVFDNPCLSEKDFQENTSVLLAKFSILPIGELEIFLKPRQISMDEIHYPEEATLARTFRGFVRLLNGQDPTVELNDLLGKSSNVLAYSYLGLYYFRAGHLQEALVTYSRAINEYPDEPYFYAARCLMNRALADEEGAFYDYQVAKKLDFNYHSVLEWHEYLLDAETDPEEVSEYLPELDNQEEINALGLTYLQNFDYMSALKLYNSVIDMYPTRGDAFVFRGNIFLKMTLFEKVIQDMDRAIQCDKTLLSAYVGKAKVFESYHWYDQAFQAYEAALLIDSSVPVLYEERAGLFMRLHLWQDAIGDFNRLIELNSDDFYPYVLRADVREKLNDWKGALSDYNMAISLNPYYSDLYSYRSDVKKHLGDVLGAESDRRRYLELEDE